jgi:hypothetical protein
VCGVPVVVGCSRTWPDETGGLASQFLGLLLAGLRGRPPCLRTPRTDCGSPSTPPRAPRRPGPRMPSGTSYRSPGRRPPERRSSRSPVLRHGPVRRTSGGLFTSQEWRIASSPGPLGYPPRSATSSSAPATGPGFPRARTQRPVPASVTIRCRGCRVVRTVERLAGQGDRGGSPTGMLMPRPGPRARRAAARAGRTGRWTGVVVRRAGGGPLPSQWPWEGWSACTEGDPTVGRGIVSWVDTMETWRPTAGSYSIAA